jgi:quercetin dioxygenase-like cupin family protein
MWSKARYLLRSGAAAGQTGRYLEETMPDYTYFPDIGGAVPPVAADSILSRTLLKNDHVRTLVFNFAPGQELSEHTSALPAVLHVLSGSGRVTLGAESLDVAAGFWAFMPPNLAHSVEAATPLTLLLLLLPGGAA